ncbi:hypothetical protein [Pedobacter aquatilis]|uniref:hypothetical protein n=1 Tax=Pedobacter aquatilis TaxID=351343 RepID=UPI0029307BDC|nr:hypothetical protein [Pedobacter aquatilis]
MKTLMPSIKWLKPFLILCCFFFLYSCKKETLKSTENIDLKLQSKTLEYLSGPKTQILNYSEFANKVNISNLGSFKSQFIKPAGMSEKIMSLSVPESYSGLKINKDSVVTLTYRDHTSYIFQIELSSKHATSFQNLTIDESKERTTIFVTTYTPSKNWIANWKLKKNQAFDGDISHTLLYDSSSAISTRNINSIVKDKLLLSSVPTKISLAEFCYEFTVYNYYEYSCASGLHSFADRLQCQLT